MSYRLRENLELFTEADRAVIRCAQCAHIFCDAGQDWKTTAAVRFLPPTAAGPLMRDAHGKYALRQSVCPGCGVLLDSDLVEEEKPTEAKEKTPAKPRAAPVAVSARATAVLVLDLSARCEDPALVCHALLPPVAGFLAEARAAGAPVIFSVSASQRGTAMGRVAAALDRRESEPVIYPDGFDKFTGGELQRILEKSNAKSLIILGSATNVAVLYTATTAARIHRYEVIVPVDGVNARTDYAHDYALYQLSVLPGGVGKRICFTTLGTLSFT